jgi:hypothetical protein
MPSNLKKMVLSLNCQQHWDSAAMYVGFTSDGTHVEMKGQFSGFEFILLPARVHTCLYPIGVYPDDYRGVPKSNRTGR